MGGAIESQLLKLVKLLTKRVPALSLLDYPEEVTVASAHIFGHAWLGLALVTVSLACHVPLLLLGHVALYGLVVIAERGPSGRRIDWITRSAGWLLGAKASAIWVLM